MEGVNRNQQNFYIPLTVSRCPFVLDGEILGSSVERSRISLGGPESVAGSLTKLEKTTMSKRLKDFLLVRGQEHYGSVVALGYSIEAYKFELLRPDDTQNNFHRAAAKLGAFSRALELALQGQLSEDQAEALDNYFPLAPDIPDYAPWMRQAAHITGLGLCILGGTAAGIGGIMSIGDGDANDSYSVAAEVVGGAVAVLGVGVMAAPHLYQCCQTQPETLRSEERQLLEALCLCVQEENVKRGLSGNEVRVHLNFDEDGTYTTHIK